MTSNHLLLYRIAELMLVSGRHVLAVDELFDDEKIGDFVKSIQIDSPYQQMLYEGVLTETVKDEQLKVSFTIEGYFHFILSEVIYEQSEGKDANFLISLLNSSSLNGIKEGIEQCLIRDIILQQLERLISFIDSGGDYLEICIRPLLYLMKSHGVEYTLNKLLENPTDKDWNALLQLNELLDKLQLQVLRKEFLNSVINRISFNNKFEIQLGLEAIAEIDDEHARIHFARIDVNEEFIQNDLQILESLGDCHKRFGDYDKAQEIYEKCLEEELRTSGGEYSNVARFYQEIGIIWEINAEYSKSLDFLQKSLEIRLKYFGDEHLSIGDIHHSIGFTLDSRGDYEKALFHYIESLRIKIKNLGGFHFSVSTSYICIGAVWYEKGDYEKALDYYMNSLKIDLKIFGGDNHNIATLYSNIALVYARKDKFEKALEFCDKALQLRLKTLGREHIMVANSYNNIGYVLSGNKEYEKSLKFYKKALKILLKALNGEHPLIANQYFDIGKTYESLLIFNSAIDFYKKGYLIKRKGGYPFRIAFCLEILDDKKEALNYYIQSAEIRKTDPDVGLEHESTQESINNIQRLFKEMDLIEMEKIPEWLKEYINIKN